MGWIPSLERRGARARATAGGASIGLVLFVALPVLAIVLAVTAALGLGDMYQARQRYEDTLARTYRAEVAARDARAASTIELATVRTAGGGSPLRRRASARLRDAEAAALAAVRGDRVTERLLGRQLAAQRRARAALQQSPRRLARELSTADGAADALVRRQGDRRMRARELARTRSAGAAVRSVIAGGLALVATLTLLWLLLRGVHRPVAALVRASERLAQDDLTARVDPTGPTEIRRLGDAFNTMADRLEARQIELQEALAAAEQANQTKVRFLSRVSHELRTPLNAIMGFSQLLEFDDLTERQQASVAHVREAGRHLLSLVDDVLEVAGVEPATARLALEPVDLGEVIGEVADATRELAERRGVSLAVELPGTQPVIAHADRDAARSILLHLVINGIKYNRASGHVRIVAGGDEQRVRVAVSDSGPGVPEDQLGKLFVPFERLGAEEAGIDGMGVGLAVSQRHAREMGGVIEVTSRVDEGSRFTLTLPASTA